MQRRKFVTMLGGVTVTLPFAVSAQHARKIPRVGVLWHAANAEEESEYLSVLAKAFSDLGYEDGKSIELLHRYPAEQPERFRLLAEELVQASPDVIIAVTGRGTREVRKATKAIPIVFVLISDPVADGYVESLSHPGGNMTGTSLMGTELSGKRLAMLREIIPGLRRIALVCDFQYPPSSLAVKSFQNEASGLGMEVETIQVLKPDDLAPTFAAIAGGGAGAAFVLGSLLFNERRRVGELSLVNKVPTCSIIAEMVPYGLLMSYGQDYPDFFRKAATTASRILKGARPAELPVEQPTRFKLAINLRTARALGLKIPESLLSTADEVID